MHPLPLWRVLLSPLLLLCLALSMPSRAQQLPPDSGYVVVYVLLERWKWHGRDRLEVEAKSGSWIHFPPDGMSIVQPFRTCDGQEAVAVRLPRARLEEITRLIAENIPPHEWAIEDGRFLPPYIHSWGCNKF